MAKKQTTAVAVLSKDNLTQQDVPALLAAVNEKITALKGNKDKDNRTNGDLPGVGNIFSMTDQASLISAYASVETREEGYKKAVKNMKLDGKVPEYKLGGASAKAWKDDITRRYNEVTYKDQLEKLNNVRKELEQHLSAEDKLNASLGNIKNILLD